MLAIVREVEGLETVEPRDPYEMRSKAQKQKEEVL
jgi:hypothetical protein